MMGQTLLVVVLFVAAMAMLPLAVKWIQRRAQGAARLRPATPAWCQL